MISARISETVSSDPPFLLWYFKFESVPGCCVEVYVPFLICQWFAASSFVFPLQSALKGVAEKVHTCYSSVQKDA